MWGNIGYSSIKLHCKHSKYSALKIFVNYFYLLTSRIFWAPYSYKDVHHTESHVLIYICYYPSWLCVPFRWFSAKCFTRSLKSKFQVLAAHLLTQKLIISYLECLHYNEMEDETGVDETEDAEYEAIIAPHLSTIEWSGSLLLLKKRGRWRKKKKVEESRLSRKYMGIERLPTPKRFFMFWFRCSRVFDSRACHLWGTHTSHDLQNIML